jgi:hypothetical protein
MTWTNAGAEYAIRWINGKAPKTGIDEKILAECMAGYVKEVTGSTVQMSMVNRVEAGKELENFKLVLMGYLTY